MIKVIFIISVIKNINYLIFYYYIFYKVNNTYYIIKNIKN